MLRSKTTSAATSCGPTALHGLRPARLIPPEQREVPAAPAALVTPPTVTKGTMGNVTDSLDRIAHLLQRARDELAPVGKMLDVRTADLYKTAEVARGRVLLTVVMLDDLRDVIQSERRVLDRLASISNTKACAHCGRTFEFIVGAGREPAYCSQGCRQRAYRGRQASQQQ